MKDNHINVFFASDDNYARPMAVTLTSVVANTKSFVNFYVLENNISEEVKAGIEEIKKNYDNFSIEYISVDIEVFKDFPVVEWFNLTVYIRFLIAEIRKDINKAIYLDCDMVLKKDIRLLFDIDLGEYALGAFPETTSEWLSNHVNVLHLDKQHKYFNSGMLLIDCVKWREENVLKKLMETTYYILKDKLKFPDQDVFNVVFENNYKPIDNEYLIHYSGIQKPWKERNMVQANTFWEYAKLTPFYEILYENSSESKFLFLRERLLRNRNLT